MPMLGLWAFVNLSLFQISSPLSRWGDRGLTPLCFSEPSISPFTQQGPHRRLLAAASVMTDCPHAEA